MRRLTMRRLRVASSILLPLLIHIDNTRSRLKMGHGAHRYTLCISQLLVNIYRVGVSIFTERRYLIGGVIHKSTPRGRICTGTTRHVRYAKLRRRLKAPDSTREVRSSVAIEKALLWTQIELQHGHKNAFCLIFLTRKRQKTTYDTGARNCNNKHPAAAAEQHHHQEQTNTTPPFFSNSSRHGGRGNSTPDGLRRHGRRRNASAQLVPSHGRKVLGAARTQLPQV